VDSLVNEGLDVPLTIQISASEAEADRLVDVTRQIEPCTDAIVYGTNADDIDTVREVINHRQGVSQPSTPV